MDYSFIRDYLTKEFAPDAYGPEKFDCYGLVWHLNFHYNGVDLPRFDDMELQRDRINACIQGQALTEDWREVKQPRDFDLVLMKRAGEAYHVGCWFDVDGGKVVHATPKGVLCNDLGGLRRMHFQHIQFYRYATDAVR